MIIDDHVHVHEWSFQKGDREFEVDYVVELMDEWGIDNSIIMDSLAYIGLDQWASNDHTREAVDAYPDRLIGFANIKPPQGFAACRDEIVAHDRRLGISRDQAASRRSTAIRSTTARSFIR